MPEKEKTKRVLEWLAKTLAWCSEDPANRIEYLAEQLYKNKDLILNAILDAMEPEVRKWVEENILPELKSLIG